MYRVAVIKGDGIGIEVTEAAMEVINAVTNRIEFVEFEGGFEVFKRYGVPIRDEDLEEIKKMDAGFIWGDINTFRRSKLQKLDHNT